MGRKLRKPYYLNGPQCYTCLLLVTQHLWIRIKIPNVQYQRQLFTYVQRSETFFFKQTRAQDPKTFTFVVWIWLVDVLRVLV